MKGIINFFVVLGLAFFVAGCAKEEASEFNERKDLIAVYLQSGAAAPALLNDVRYDQLAFPGAKVAIRSGAGPVL